MKRIVVIILIAFAPIPSIAQGWKTVALNAQVGAFGVHDTFLFIGTSKEILRYTVANGYEAADNGIDFSQGSVTSFASLGNYFFAGSAPPNQGIGFLTTNNGSIWTEVIGGPIGTNGTYLYGQFASRIALSVDSGKLWTHLSAPAGNSYAANGAYVYTYTPNNGIWRSTDSGGTWTEISTPFSGTVTTMGTLVFMVGTGRLVESIDSGSQWDTVAVDSASVQEHVNCLATDGKNLFAGTNDGVFISTDIGKTWRQENDGLGIFLKVNLLGVFDTLVFVNATDITNLGKWYTASRSIREMVDTNPASVVQLQLPDSLMIYPNPASGTVTILSGGTSFYGVSVLNVLGEDVLDMPNLRESDITLDVSKLPSGTYFLHIEMANGSVLRKVVVQH